MKYKELEDFFVMANSRMTWTNEQMGALLRERLTSEPETNLYMYITMAQDRTKQAIKEYERIVKRKKHEPDAEILKTRREIDDWIYMQKSKKSAKERKQRTQNLILLGAAFLPVLSHFLDGSFDQARLTDAKIEKIKKIVLKNESEIKNILLS